MNTAPSERYCDVQKINTFKIEQFLRNGSKDISRQALDSFLEEAGYFKTNSLLLRLYVAMELYIVIRSFSKEIGVSNEDFVSKYGSVDDIEYKLLNLEHSMDFFTSMLEDCIDRRVKHSCNNGNNTVLKAIEHIRENYTNEDISLKSVAAHVNLSPTYFCSLFKKETGMNFSDYLSKVRIDKSAELLKRTSKTISEIAFEVGFSDYRYFSQIFKKFKGETPREYHTRNMKESARLIVQD